MLIVDPPPAIGLFRERVLCCSSDRLVEYQVGTKFASEEEASLVWDLVKYGKTTFNAVKYSLHLLLINELAYIY